MKYKLYLPFAIVVIFGVIIFNSKQTITMEAPAGMTNFLVKKGNASIKRNVQKNSRLISLPPNQEIMLEINAQ